ncbi:MAG TPA: hypothetical protein VE954_05295 [Oligoflexus sp.]|uniref:hypothetical protein n=1 Tax=Oligoflexus sp. TaxID=1971216 RepID=UPI002D52E2CD|nr:hypothetical protein [Oligoflexus sp.]HYX32508.1 hypothetical protein [Oligoflexus sp.]
MGQFVRALSLSAFLLATQALFAAEVGNLSTIQTGESSLTTVVSEPKDVARVRIPLRFTRFEPIIVQNAQGTRRMEHKAMAPVAYTLRATINRSNHFYLSDWHIETVPMKWEKETRNWQVEIKVYKRYGQEQELEEFIGTQSLQGRLVGIDKLFTLETQTRQQFNNKRGSPLLLIESGSIAVEKGNVARRTP